MRLCSGYAGDRGHGAGSGGAKGLGSIAVRGDGVLDGGPVLRVGAVVVADEHVTVDVAQADEVVALLVARVDARLVAGDTSVDNAVGRWLVFNFSFNTEAPMLVGMGKRKYILLSSALGLRSNESGRRGDGNSNGGRETHLED